MLQCSCDVSSSLSGKITHLDDINPGEMMIAAHVAVVAKISDIVSEELRPQ